MSVTGRFSNWDIVIKIIGIELSEIIRERLKGEQIAVPSAPPKAYLVPLVKDELRERGYEELARKYRLSSRTIRRYEKWEIHHDRIISPSGREYRLLDQQIQKRTLKKVPD